jgi:tRNA (guanine-N7-)-methyltransferase
VGSGKGLFLQTAAAHSPEHDFLGIEIGRKYARFTAARLARHELSNAVVVHGDGMKLFREILPGESLAAVHVYFPDPWWKKRHHKRRLLNEPFLKDVVRVLNANGRLHFWTDVKEYYDRTLELISMQNGLQGPIEVPEEAPAHNLDYRTHFERRTRLQDAPVYRSEFVKRAES